MNASETIQILVNLSVVAGLILLVYELHQNRQFARFQFVESRTANFLTFEQSMSNQAMASLWIKSISDPVSLELSEIRMLDIYLFSHFQIWRSRWNLELAGLADAGTTKQTLDADVPFYLGSTFGRIWWQNLKAFHSATIEWFENMKRQLAEASAGS